MNFYNLTLHSIFLSKVFVFFSSMLVCGTGTALVANHHISMEVASYLANT